MKVYIVLTLYCLAVIVSVGLLIIYGEAAELECAAKGGVTVSVNSSSYACVDLSKIRLD